MKPSTFPSPTDDAALGSPTAETRRQRGPDGYLRRNGFKIHARPKTGEPVWQSLDGKLLPESEAIIMADALEDQPE